MKRAIVVEIDTKFGSISQRVSCITCLEKFLEVWENTCNKQHKKNKIKHRIYKKHENK